MSRRRTNLEDIRNPEHYFNSYMAKEAKREQEAAETSLLGWIDQIEDQRLYTAISGLSERQKILLSLRYQRCLSQKDVALIMGMAQQTVSRYENRDFISTYYEGIFQRSSPYSSEYSICTLKIHIRRLGYVPDRASPEKRQATPEGAPGPSVAEQRSAINDG